MAALATFSAAKAAEIEHPAEEWVSGTLPVLYITTEDSLPVTSKEEYLQGTYYLDPMGCEGVEAIGGRDEQLPLEIKGRGNSSWKQVKKPYRLKLVDKAPLLGMRKNRHWCLLTEWMDGRGRLTWEMGFYVSRMLGLQWTPDHQPVELVLNGEYLGLYFLTEKIRVSKHRVNVTEQDDMETDPEAVTGGWLCEIDNYSDTPQVYVMDRNSRKYVRTTIHSPEALSTKQRTYIYSLVRRVDAAIYNKDKTSTEWEDLVDLDMLARFYLTNEILYEVECFGGSCFWSKDRGDSAKIMFGPVWDFDQACMWVSQQMFSYEDQAGSLYTKRNRWIDEIVKFPRFMQRVRELWQFYNDSVLATMEPHAVEWTERLRGGADRDVLRWYYELKDRSDLTARRVLFLRRLRAHHNFLAAEWAKPLPVIGDANADGRIDSLDVALVADSLLGRPAGGIDMVNADTYCDSILDLSDLVGVARQVWLAEHPAARLTYPQLLPYTQSDKAIDTAHAVTALPGVGAADTVAVPVAVTGTTAYSAVAMDVAVSDGNVVAATLAGAPKHRLLMRHLDDTPGTVRIIVWSDSLDSRYCSATEPMLTLQIALSDPEADHTISFTATQLAEADMFPHHLADATMTLDWSTIVGDVNADGMVDVADANALLNIALGSDRPSRHAITDINGDGVVDVTDVNIVINLILGSNTSLPTDLP